MDDIKCKCNVCGEEWWYLGEDICPFCGVDDTTIVYYANDEYGYEEDWGQYRGAWIGGERV